MDKFSFLNAVHPAYFAEVYDQYLQYPDSVEPSWRAFFQGFDFANTPYGQELTEENAQVYIEPNTGTEVVIPTHVFKELQVVELIDAYRTRGHLFTKTNPVRERRQHKPSLAIENFGLTPSDMDEEFFAGSIIGMGKARLSAIIERLKNIYCGAIGIEYMHTENPEIIKWFQEKLNEGYISPNFSDTKKKHILNKLNQAVSFENFLHTKYVGQKRFSLEGGETFIAGIDMLIEKAATMGVKEFVLGMAHRGRLNTLANIFGKDPKKIFSEFDGKDYDHEELFDGDVKYHLGWTSTRQTSKGEEINLNIAPNPSHLETVAAVVEGITRAKQDKHPEYNASKVLPMVVHGDAAIAGQGIVYEVIQMAKLDAYKTQGTIHVVINNQVGFTTNYLDARSSIYCTDIAKVTQSPVFHINADDAEAVVQGMLFALEYRMKFGQDVFIDLLGYRKYGHNEGDEPRFTQPKLYKIIAKHDNARDIYAEKLQQEGLITKEEVSSLEQNYKDELEKSLEDSRKEEKTIITPIMEKEWEGFEQGSLEDMLSPTNTSFPQEKLNQIATIIGKLPKERKYLRKIQKLIEARYDMYFNKNELDWGMAELLAYGTLLEEGYDVRISGQDVERGTFSHRHAVVKTEDNEEKIILLNQLSKEQGTFSIYNSHLSEYGVVGFEYGYAMANPNSLTIWEAQFGDFSNGAQIMLDQYISAAEDKWKLQNGLVMLLPHGYEGQGAEHSSARMERYLQLCANKNMFVADCTTPANFFHLLRRQVKQKFRKPLVVFTPKSLLRHPKVVSTKEELSTGSFQPIIDDNTVNSKNVKTLVFCTGKFYYDLLAYREEQNREDVALVRIEQLFPLDKEGIKAILKKYSNANDVVWAQEEPKNMGAYSYLLLHLEEVRNFRVCSRHMYSAPAAGSAVRSKRRHQKVIESVFNIE